MLHRTLFSCSFNEFSHGYFSLTGAASLRTGAVTASGEKINVGCLCKIEMNVQANAMRVTLRTLHPAATSAILATAKSLLI